MLAEFCISSLVIVCLVKSFYELNIRFFGPAVSAGAARVSSPCPKWRRRRLLLPSHVQAPARPVAQHQNFGEKEKTRVLALLRHIHLPYSVASDEKLLETSHAMALGRVVPRRRAIAGCSDRTGGGSMERNCSPGKRP